MECEVSWDTTLVGASRQIEKNNQLAPKERFTNSVSELRELCEQARAQLLAIRVAGLVSSSLDT